MQFILVSAESKDSEGVCQVKIVLGCYERNFMDGNLNMNLCVQYESRPQRGLLPGMNGVLTPISRVRTPISHS